MTDPAETSSRNPPAMFLNGDSKDAAAARVAREAPAPARMVVASEPIGTPWLVLFAFLFSMIGGWLVFSGTMADWLRPAPLTELSPNLRKLP